MSKLTPQQALALFVDDRTRRNYSPESIRLYRHHLRQFFIYLDANADLDLTAVTTRTLQDYIRWLGMQKNANGDTYSHSSKQNAAKTLRGFFAFLKDKNHVLVDPAEALPSQKKPHHFPASIMTIDEVELLLSQPDTGTLRGFRDRTIMETLFASAVRRAELCNLTVYDVDLSSGLLRVTQGKGKRDRVVPIGTVAVNYLREYLDGVRPLLASDTGKGGVALFLTFTAVALSPQYLNAVIARYVRWAKLTERRINCHAFRHTCATEMIRGGCNVRYVQEHLGHADIDTTQIYTHIAPVDLREALLKSHPRERVRNADAEPFATGKTLRYRQKKRSRKQ